MQGLDNEFDHFGEGSPSSGGLATDHPHSEEHQPSTNVQHTQSNRNDMAANSQEVSIEPSATTTRKRRRRVILTEEELRDRSIKNSARRRLRKVLAMAAVTPADLERSIEEKVLRREERKIAKQREAKALTTDRLEAKESVEGEQQRNLQQRQQQRQDSTEGDDQYQRRELKVEDGQSMRPEQKRLQRATSELTEKQLARKAQIRKANLRYRERESERKRLANEGRPPPPPGSVLAEEQRIKQEEALLKKIQEEREERERQKEMRKRHYTKFNDKRVAKRQEGKQLAESYMVQPVLTEEEQAKRDRKRKANQEAGVRFRERLLTKQLLQHLARTLQGDPAAAQPPHQLLNRYVGINAPTGEVENVKEKVLAIRTKNGVKPDEPIRVEDLEAILPSRSPVLKRGRKKGVRYRRIKAKLQEDARRQREEEDTTPVVVPTALQPQPYFRRKPKLESRLFKKPRPKDLDPGVPDIQATTAAHLAYSLMTREQRLALTLSVLDPEKEFEAYRWPVRESVLPSVPVSKYLDEDARPMPDSFERKGMAFVSELTGVPKSEHDYEISGSDEDDEEELERLLDERRASKRQRKEQQENERSSTQRLTEVHRFFRDEVTTFAQKQYHKAFPCKKPSPYPDLKKIRASDQDELTLLQENAAAFSAEDTLLSVLDRIPFVIRQGALGKNPEYMAQGRKLMTADASYERGWNSVMLAATMAGVDERILKKVSYRMKILLSHSRNMYYHESEPQTTVEAKEDQDQDVQQNRNQNPQEEHPEIEEDEYPEIEEDEYPEIEEDEYPEIEEEMGVQEVHESYTDEELLLPEHVFNKT
ncbi:hypothetical protein CPC16_003306 [Podila verticillata]|nr:hypothetical protein CPC16_003306 [Podila verticillata]